MLKKTWKTIFCSVNLNNRSIKRNGKTLNHAELGRAKSDIFFYSFDLTHET